MHNPSNSRRSRFGGIHASLLAAAALATAVSGALAGPYEGYGSVTQGGAGGDVYHVTSLANSGPGTLRDGVLNRSGPRTIVFDVGGTITLTSDLAIKMSYLTIDGSTAPYPGITIKQYSLENGSTVIAKCSDIILNNLRFYGVYTAGGETPNVTGCFGVEGGTSRIVLDHLTIRNSSDSGPDFWGGISDVTMSYCLIMYSYHPTTISHYPAPYQVRQRMSLHHNVWARNQDRNPQVRADVRDLDFVNNVIYHWGYYYGNGQGSRIRNDSGEPKVNLNIINNYWVPVSNPSWALVYGINPGADSSEGRGTSSNPPQGTVLTNTAMGDIYTMGNILPPENLDQYSTISAPLPVPAYARVTTHSADQLKAVVLPSVGTHYRLPDEQSAIDELNAIMIGSTPPECTSSAQCDDGAFCNGAEACVNGTCQPGTPPCAGGQCDEAADACVQCFSDADCSDGSYCNGAETCVNGACQPGTNPCPDGTCDEATDTCDPTGRTVVWMSFRVATAVPNVGMAGPEDIVGYDLTDGTWSMVFDGSDVGLTGMSIDGVARLTSGELLLSFASAGNVPALQGGPGGGTYVDDSDIVRFAPTSLGANTAGTFTFHFDGSDVGLTTDAANVTAIASAPDGRLLISTAGPVTVGGVSADGKDVLAFTPASLGDSTSGSWDLYFDGSDVGLDTTDEDMDALALTGTGSLLLSTLNGFQVPGVSGGDEDIIEFRPSALGATTAGTFHMFLDLTTMGISDSADVVAVELHRQTASALKADFNDDGVVNAEDVTYFEACISGPYVAQTDPNCAETDQDGDLDVDQEDFGLMQSCMTGDTPPPDPHCYR